MHAMPSKTIFSPHVMHISVNVSSLLAYSDGLYCRLGGLPVSHRSHLISLHEHVTTTMRKLSQAGSIYAFISGLHSKAICVWCSNKASSVYLASKRFSMHTFLADSAIFGMCGSLTCIF